MPIGASGNEMLQRAQRSLLQKVTIAGKIRHHIRLYDQQLIGTGVYFQQYNPVEGKLWLRFELTIQLDKQTAILRQVRDGRFLWIYRSFPEKTTLNRVDLRRVTQAMQEAEENDFSGDFQSELLLGGLPGLLAALEKSFDFETPRVLPDPQGGTIELVGHWNRDALVHWIPETAGAAAGDEAALYARLPEQMPHRVVLRLGRNDLFPYSVIFQKLSDRAAGKKSGQLGPDDFEPVVTMEFLDVVFGQQIDPIEFVVNPGEVEVFDVTDEYLRKLLPPRPDNQTK